MAISTGTAQATVMSVVEKVLTKSTLRTGIHGLQILHDTPDWFFSHGSKKMKFEYLCETASESEIGSMKYTYFMLQKEYYRFH